MSRLAIDPVPVIIVKSPEELTSLAVEFGAWSTVTVPQIGANTATLPPILSRRPTRDEARIFVLGTSNVTSPAVVTPAVPATTVAAQNPNPYGVQVVINANGATISNVSVNGVTVGTAAGTYFVPQFGAISISYTVATPTWTWTQFPAVTSGATAVVFAHRADYVSNPANPQGAILPLSASAFNFPYRSQQPLYAVGIGGPVTIVTLDTAQAAKEAQAEEAVEYNNEEELEGQSIGPDYQ